MRVLTELFFLQDRNRQVLDWESLLFFLFIFLTSLTYSESFAFFPGSRRLLLGLLLGLNLFAFVRTLFLRDKRVAFAAFPYVFLFVYTAIFAFQFRTPATGGLMASFPALCSVATFINISRRRPLRQVLELMFIASLVYMVVFCYFFFFSDLAAIAAANRGDPGDQTSVLAGHASDTGTERFRVKISPFHMSLAFFYAFERLRAKVRTLWLALTVFVGFCIVISDFRFFLLTIALVAAVRLTPISNIAKARGGLGLITALCLLVTTSTLVGFNYYRYFVVDNTGYARFLEAKIVLSAYIGHVPFGIGLFSDVKDLYSVYHADRVYTSDLGLMGELARYGLIGMFLIVFLNYVIFLLIARLVQLERADHVTERCLTDIFLFVIIYQVTSPMLVEDAGGLMIALALAFRSGVVAPRHHGHQLSVTSHL